MQQNTMTITKIAILLTILLIALLLSAGASRPTIPAAEAVVLWDEWPLDPGRAFDLSRSGIVADERNATDYRGWIQRIVSQQSSIQFLQAELDQSNHIHISYLLGQTSLYYGHNKQTTWNIGPVGDNYLGHEINMALDNQGNPHIIYREFSQIYYVHMNANGWRKELLLKIPGIWVGYHSSIAVDQFDRPHVTFMDNSARYLFYGVKNGHEWSFTYFVTPHAISPKTVVKIGPGAEPFIAFATKSNVKDTHYLYLYFMSGGNWYGTSKAINGIFSEFDFVVDNTGYPLFTYTYVPQNSSQMLYFTFPVPGGWYETPISNCPSCKHSMVLNKQGNPFVAFFSSTARIDMYELSGSGWESTGYFFPVGNLEQVDMIFIEDIPEFIVIMGTGIHNYYYFEPVTGLTASGPNPIELGQYGYFQADVATGKEVTYSWTFGDGTGSSGKNVYHKYSTLGNKIVEVTAKNLANSTWTNYSVKVINAKIRNLSIGGAVPTVFGELNTLTARHSTGTNVTYSWDLGDGQTAQGATANHVYEAPGVYTVTLQAVNTSSSAIQTAQIAVQEPVAGLAITHTQPVTPGATVLFAATTISGTGLAYQWGFGDATWATGLTTTHTLACTGIYTITLRAYNYVSEQIVQERFETPMEITPDGGCTVVAENIVLIFPPDFVTDTVKVLYQQIPYDQAGPLVPLRPAFSVALSSSVTSTITTTRTSPTPYQLTVGYTDEQLATLNPETVAVHTSANEGWIPFPDFSDERINNLITVTPTEFGTWALLGTHALYMPLMSR